MELKDLCEIPKELPFSGKIGADTLFKLKWQIIFLNGLILKKKKRDPFSGKINRMVADLSAKVWAIIYIVDTETKLKNANVSFKVKETYGNNIPEIPNVKFKYKERSRLKRLISRVEYLQNKKKERKSNVKIKTLDYDLSILLWVINHVIYLKETENRLS